MLMVERMPGVWAYAFCAVSLQQSIACACIFLPMTADGISMAKQNALRSVLVLF